jgi:hypothetical protein
VFDPRAAAADVGVVELQRLGQAKTCSSRSLPTSAARIVSIDEWLPHRGRSPIHGIALASDNRSDDPHAGRAGDIRDNMMEPQIHLRQSLLHVLDMGGCVFHQPLPLTQIGAQACYFGIRDEAAAQQAIGMELAQPSGGFHRQV